MNDSIRQDTKLNMNQDTKQNSKQDAKQDAKQYSNQDTIHYSKKDIKQYSKQDTKLNDNLDPYYDMLNMPRHISRTHAHMSIYDRAAQFSPFAALTGYDSEIKEAARLTDQRVDLDEAEKTILDEKIQIILNKIEERAEVTITFFKPDEKKTGGVYVSKKGIVRKVDSYTKEIVLLDNTRIEIEQIVDISGDIFGMADGLLW